MQLHLQGVSSKIPLAHAVPGALLLALCGLALGLAPESALLAQAARGYPYVALAAALLLATRLQRTRLFAACVAVSIVHLLMRPAVLGSNALAAALFVTFMPFGFALLAVLRDDAFSVKRAVQQLALLFLPLLLAAFFSAADPAGAVRFLNTGFVDPIYTDWAAVPQAALLAAAVSLIIIALAALRSLRATESGLAWTALALVCALAAPAGSVQRSIWVLAGALALIVALVETAYALAYHDELTGLPGRRALAQAVASLEAPYAIAIVDVDRFKAFNDTYGHDVGDQVLCMVASRLRAVTGGGRAFRTGGEEFTIVFPGLGKKDALPHAEAMREEVEAAAFTVRAPTRASGRKAVARRGSGSNGRQQLRVTVSVGVASPGARDATVEAVTRAADKAMYRAKNEGRNRVIA